MATGKRTMLVGAVIVSAAVLAGAATATMSITGGIQQALAALARGELDQAERQAVQAIDANGPAGGRAWLIAAEARRRGGKLTEAEEAYRAFLAVSANPAERAYAVEQIASCARQPAGPAPMQLTDDQRRQLGAVDKRTYTESSENFVVFARNAELARRVAVGAQQALRRICGSILAGQEYPHSVRIYVWPTLRQYRKHAAASVEWAGGSFTYRRHNGQAVRRIDLTQLDEKGQFDTEMLTRVLPHEMCHLVLAELFGDATAPLALNEGLAMLAEETTDNSYILLAGAALSSDAKIPLDELLAMEHCDGDSAAAFYAESFSLAEYLRQRLSAGQFREVLDHLRAGLPLDESIQRALYVPLDDDFSDRLARAWEADAVKQAQFLRALEVASSER